MSGVRGGCERCNAPRAMDTSDAPLVFSQLCVSCQKEIVPAEWGDAE